MLMLLGFRRINVLFLSLISPAVSFSAISLKDNVAEVPFSGILLSHYKSAMGCVTTVHSQVRLGKWMLRLAHWNQFLYFLYPSITVITRTLIGVEVERSKKEQFIQGHAKLVISLLQAMQDVDQRMTMLQLVDRLKNKQRQLDFELKREEMEQLVVQLIINRVLKEEFQHTAYATNAYVKVGPTANLVMQGKKIIKMELGSILNGMDDMRKSIKHGVTSGLESKLDELRKELASHDEGIFPHSVLSGQQISSISANLPKSIEEAKKIIGKLKTEKYGERILEEVKKYGNAEHPNNDESNKEQSTEEEGHRHREHPNNNELKEEESPEEDGHTRKKLKTDKQVIMVDSSNDEAEA
ncbi:RECQ helicase L2 isoform 2 [Hibiscus syriacus]|uniref:RECQ helicase L2 isoform 2 n=1 Tax=Hibiscus syriacus TaxID=106335 RepID=A0A6A3A419_HIBSY|nr:RECQ helicase L2 isoform 2 [Hibiscus syriacus]